MIAGCAQDALPINEVELGLVPPVVDMATPPVIDLARPPEVDAAQPPNECGDHESSCATVTFAPPFALHSDPKPDPSESDDGLKRDINGYLVLDAAAHAPFEYLWVVSTSDLATAGSVSKFSIKNIREVARYRPVTCSSLKTGSTAMCDGTNGCCTADDNNRYQARLNNMPEPGHQGVQLTTPYPSRTAVDEVGDVYVANQAFGGQSSVTRIASDPSECVDRNHNGRIDTSSDTNGNGFIETDCNGNGTPDDIADVQNKPCINNLQQEFYNLDDECVIWTTNTFVLNAIGRAIAGVPRKGGGTDVWAGGYSNTAYALLDGATGRTKADAKLAQGCSGPFGALADNQGIVWSGPLGGGKLCWFDSANPGSSGIVRDPQWGQTQGFGLIIDRDQNVWCSTQVARYTPDRSNGTKNLGNGWWTRFGNFGGIGMAADARNAKDYFAYVCTNGAVVQVPASATPAMKVDQQIADAGWPRINMPCYGVGVDTEQNVWGVSMQQVTRALVDKTGKVTQPVWNGMAMGNNVCPAGDACKGAAGEVFPDFTGFNPARPSGPTGGHYSRVIANPGDCASAGRMTRWLRLTWDADVPAGTALTARFRTGATSVPDNTWSAWTPAPSSPDPLDFEGTYLQIEFAFTTATPGTTPSLKSFALLSECI